MHKWLLGLIVGVSVAGAYDASVKKTDVTIAVNGVEKQYKAGDIFELHGGDIVCFVSGKGRVVISGKHYKKQLSHHSKTCKHLPYEDGSSSSYVSAIESGVVSIFQKSKEKSVDGVSRKSTTLDTLTAPIALKSDAKYLLVENSSWGPLPVTLKLTDENGTVVLEEVNEEDIPTSFVLMRSGLKDGYRLQVTNAFGDSLVDSTIHIEK